MVSLLPLTDRIRDLSDLQKLLRNASPTDIETAVESVRLIVARGFSEGRDLETDLKQLIVKFA